MEDGSASSHEPIHWAFIKPTSPPTSPEAGEAVTTPLSDDIIKPTLADWPQPLWDGISEVYGVPWDHLQPLSRRSARALPTTSGDEGISDPETLVEMDNKRIDSEHNCSEVDFWEMVANESLEKLKKVTKIANRRRFEHQKHISKATWRDLKTNEALELHKSNKAEAACSAGFEGMRAMAAAMYPDYNWKDITVAEAHKVVWDDDPERNLHLLNARRQPLEDADKWWSP